MATRAGMDNLLGRLRTMAADKWQLHQDLATGDGSNKTYWLANKPENTGGTVSVGGTVQGTAAYSWDTDFGKLVFTTPPPSLAAVVVEYQAAQFGDDQLQDTLDGNATLLEGVGTDWLPDVVAGGVATYHRLKVPYRDLEGPESGTVYWRVADSLGNVAGTTGYSADAVRGEVRFTADQAGTAYYLTARSYDLNGAAADVWQMWAAHYADWFNFSTEQKRFERKAVFDNAMLMVQSYRQRGGANKPGSRGGLRTGAFVRRDLNRSER